MESWVGDRAVIYADPDLYRQFGLLLLAVLFHEDVNEVEL
jgi:hypothetical protein